MGPRIKEKVISHEAVFDKVSIMKKEKAKTFIEHQDERPNIHVELKQL